MLHAFFVSVMANVAAWLICKWLDGYGSDDWPDRKPRG